mmetsp:Transcript_25653/g.41705  ORF Transcript_25653/g.41705 Transcript_25653/m.41705 type:complete len:86 (-) Transcript_25653:491-748(-)
MASSNHQYQIKKVGLDRIILCNRNSRRNYSRWHHSKHFSAQSASPPPPPSPQHTSNSTLNAPTASHHSVPTREADPPLPPPKQRQ